LNEGHGGARQRAQGGKASRRRMQKCERVQQWLPPKRNKGLNDRAACMILEKLLGGHSARLDLCD